MLVKPGYSTLHALAPKARTSFGCTKRNSIDSSSMCTCRFSELNSAHSASGSGTLHTLVTQHVSLGLSMIEPIRSSPPHSILPDGPQNPRPSITSCLPGDSPTIARSHGLGPLGSTLTNPTIH